MPFDAYMGVIKLRIRQARLARNLRQEDVAEQLRISVRAYQRFESQSGRAFEPKLASLLAIAEALELDICDLVSAPSRGELGRIEQGMFSSERVFKTK